MNLHYPFPVRPLPYSLSAFEPYCDPDTLYLHHRHYYAPKVQALNRLVVQHRLTNACLETLLTEKPGLPTVQAAQLLDTAGAVYNHELYFDSLQAEPGPPPPNALAAAIAAAYGSMANFQSLLLEAAESLPGAGWAWLASEQSGVPHILLTENNEVVDLQAFQPLFVLDLWEHAYFLDDQFDKAKYMDTWFPFLDWTKADARFRAAQLG